MPHQRYKNRYGKVVPSVTTIIGRFKESGALLHWANHLAMDVLEEAMSLLQRHSQPGSERVIDFLSSQPMKRADAKVFVKEAATAGSICHSMVENWLLSRSLFQAPSITKILKQKEFHPPSIEQIARQNKVSIKLATLSHTAFSAFLEWVGNITVVETEMPLVSDFYNFGGCPDALVLRNTPSMLTGITHYDLYDWKTSGRIYPDYLIQLSAYILLIEENAYCTECFTSQEDYQENRWYSDLNDLCNGLDSEYRGDPNCTTCYGLGTTKPIVNAHCVRFDKIDGTFNHKCFTKESLEPAKDMFLQLRECYETDKTLKKMVK